MYSLTEVFLQAKNDKYSLPADGKGYEARSLYGAKIIKDNKTNNVVILNTMKGGDHYSKITEEDLKVFLDYNWKIGVYVLSLYNYRIKLDLIESLIKEEVNGKGRKRKLRELKERRVLVLKIYTEVKRKLNKTNYDKGIKGELDGF